MSRKYNRLSWQATVQEVEGMRSGAMRNSALKLYCVVRLGPEGKGFCTYAMLPLRTAVDEVNRSAMRDRAEQ